MWIPGDLRFVVFYLGRCYDPGSDLKTSSQVCLLIRTYWLHLWWSPSAAGNEPGWEAIQGGWVLPLQLVVCLQRVQLDFCDFCFCVEFWDKWSWVFFLHLSLFVLFLFYLHIQWLPLSFSFGSKSLICLRGSFTPKTPFRSRGPIFFLFPHFHLYSVFVMFFQIQ